MSTCTLLFRERLKLKCLIIVLNSAFVIALKMIRKTTIVVRNKITVIRKNGACPIKFKHSVVFCNRSVIFSFLAILEGAVEKSRGVVGFDFDRFRVIGNRAIGIAFF